MSGLQEPLFGLAAAELAAEQGMERATQAVRVQDWKQHADRWFYSLAGATEFTADDLIAAVGLPDEGPNRNNVVGAWFSSLAKARRIRFTGRHIASRRVARHANQNRVWVKR